MYQFTGDAQGGRASADDLFEAEEIPLGVVDLGEQIIKVEPKVLAGPLRVEIGFAFGQPPASLDGEQAVARAALFLLEWEGEEVHEVATRIVPAVVLHSGDA